MTSTVTASYWWFALAVVVQALGMGITTAPSTGAIMRSLPLHKAGVGSAVNDTTRELGGALGVAVMGSLVASQFRSSMQRCDQRAARRRRRTHSPTRCSPPRAAGGARGRRDRAPPPQIVVRRRVHLHAVGRGDRRGGRVGHRGVAAAPEGDGQGRRHGRRPRRRRLDLAIDAVA